MLKFKCDRCGREIARDEAWAIVLATGAYAAEGSKKRTQGEICGDCAEIILREMIYLKEVPAREDDSRRHEEKGVSARTEGRYIMIARKRAGMKIDELAKKLYICGETLKTWERGRKKKLPWDEIETVLPEAKEIREKGCEAFCPSPKACIGGGRCYYNWKRG